MTARMVCWRMIEHRRWVDDDDWLKPGDAPADGLRDLRTDNNSLSIFLFPIDDIEVWRDRVAIAMATNRQRIDTIDYAWFELSEIEALGIALVRSQAVTGDQAVNEQHADLTRLSAIRLADLAGVVKRAVDAANTERLAKRLVKAGIESAVREGRITKVASNIVLFEQAEAANKGKSASSQ